jgi:Ca2+-binding EF-hand superfamily protein
LLCSVFAKWDVDHSSTLSLEEIKVGLRELDIENSDGAVARLFIDLAQTDHGVVTLSEWLDNLPNDLATKICDNASAQIVPHSAPLRPHVQRMVDERVVGATQPSLSPLIHAFRMWDKDESMTLTLDEIQSGMKELGLPASDAEVTEVFKKLIATDSSHDISGAAVTIQDWLDNCPDHFWARN